MPVSKKRKINRKDAGKKQYRMVTFESDLYDAPFTFPDQAHMNLGLVKAINSGDVGKLSAWLLAGGVDPEEVDALDELEQEELEDFIEAWGKGSSVNLPK